MMDDNARSGAPRGMLQEIALQIPGYAGYLRKEARRDADRVARAHLAATIKRAKDAVEAHKRDRSKAGDLGALVALETLTDRLARLVSKVQNADSGYTGFFDKVQVDEAMLERVTELDHALLTEATAVEEAAKAVAGADSGATTAHDALSGRVDRFEKEFDRRRSILKGAE
jgi:hypothetical protein